jgi:acetolactate synthase-1/2/3 large subunit
MSPSSSRSAIDAAISRVQGEVHSVATTVPGGYCMPILSALVRAGFRVVVAKSEAGAALIASGIAWETERPCLCVSITGPGVFGTMQALHGASVNRVPLVLISGESSLPGATQAGDGVDGPSTTQMTAPLCAWSARIDRPSALPGALLRAVRVASFHRRPVHIAIPVHVANAQVCA